MAASKAFLGAIGAAIVLGLHGCGGAEEPPAPTTPPGPTTTMSTTTAFQWQPCHTTGVCCTRSLEQMCPGNLACGDCGGDSCQCPTPPTTPKPVPGWEPCVPGGGACCDPTNPESSCPDDGGCHFCGDVACQCCENRNSNGTCPTTTSPPPTTPTTSSPHPGPDGKCANNTQQCGGHNYTGPTCCVDKFVCLKDNDYYWACGDPDAPSTTPGPSTTTDPDAPTTTAGCGAEWAQCGGDKTYTGPSCCVEGLVCQKQKDDYANCVDPKKPTEKTTTAGSTTTTAPLNPTTPATSGATTETLSPTTAATSGAATTTLSPTTPTTSGSRTDAFLA